MPTLTHDDDTGADEQAAPYFRVPLPPPDWAAIDAVLTGLGFLPAA